MNLKMHLPFHRLLKAAAFAAAMAAAVFGCSGHSDARASRAAPHRAVQRGHSPQNVPAHVQTAEYLWSPTERQTDPRIYAPFLTWAYPLYSEAAQVRAAGIKTIFYVNPVMPSKGEYEYSQLTGQYAGVRAKDCSGNDVITYDGRGLLADPRSPQAASFYSNVITWYINNKIRIDGPNWDAFFVDNNGALYGASPLPCNYDPKTWGRAFDRAISRVNQPIVTNSLSAREDKVPAYVDRLSGKNIIGGMFEECFTNGMWTAAETSQIQTLALLKHEGKAPGPGWWCYANNTSALGAASIPQRMFVYASFLLTYDPQYSLFQESFKTDPSTFKVFPETGFVPLDPASKPKSIADLQAPGGAYVQSYAWCYYRKKPLGSCEIAVNPGHGTAEVPDEAYRHSAVLHGGGVLDGGSMSFDGPRVDDLAPGAAVILVK